MEKVKYLHLTDTCQVCMDWTIFTFNFLLKTALRVQLCDRTACMPHDTKSERNLQECIMRQNVDLESIILQML